MHLLNKDLLIKVRDFFTSKYSNCTLTMHRVLIGSIMAVREKLFEVKSSLRSSAG